MWSKRHVPRRAVLRLSLICALVLWGLASPPARAEEPPSVAAAASLRYALDEIAALFERETGRRVRLTYGATGNLVSQIENGAPFELLLAADEKSVKRLAEQGRTDGAPSIYARGRISLVAPKGSPVAVDGELKGLREALAAGKVKHFAIANPELAPYGRAAREALTRAGLWSEIEPRLVLGENIGQAAQFATTGAAEAGIIAHSLTVSSEVAPAITAALIPEAAHQPIEHGMALLKGAGETARAFAAFVRGSQARTILERNGFSVPGT
jgi:molybdate transport system substrate-binding protein